MRAIRAILFEPVGYLAEFSSEPFHEIAVRYCGRKGKASRSGSRSYWHLLNLMQPAQAIPVELEIQAVERSTLYEDALPALSELRAMNATLILASSLSQSAVDRFVKKHALTGCFDAIWTRDTSGGIKTAPLERAVTEAQIPPENALYLTDTAEGITVAKSVGVNAMLMMNDPDEARRLATRNPAGGIVSLHELADFLRLLAARRDLLG